MNHFHLSNYSICWKKKAVARYLTRFHLCFWFVRYYIFQAIYRLIRLAFYLLLLQCALHWFMISVQNVWMHRFRGGTHCPYVCRLFKHFSFLSIKMSSLEFHKKKFIKVAWFMWKVIGRKYFLKVNISKISKNWNSIYPLSGHFCWFHK